MSQPPVTQTPLPLQAAHTPAPQSISVDSMANMVRSRMPMYGKVPPEQNLQLVQSFLTKYPQYRQFVNFGQPAHQEAQQIPQTISRPPEGFLSKLSAGIASPETIGNLISTHGKLSEDIAEQRKIRDSAIAAGDPIRARVADFNARTFAGEARVLSSFTSPISIAAMGLGPLLGAFRSIPKAVQFLSGTIPAAGFGTQGGITALTPRQPGETPEASQERRFLGASQFVFGIAGLSPTARAGAFRLPDEILRPSPKVAIPEKATPRTIDVSGSVENARQQLVRSQVFEPKAFTKPIATTPEQTENITGKFVAKEKPAPSARIPEPAPTHIAPIVPTERVAQPITPYYQELAGIKEEIQAIGRKIRLHETIVSQGVGLADRLSPADKNTIKKQIVDLKDRIKSGEPVSPESQEEGLALQDKLDKHEIAKNPHLLANKDYVDLKSQQAQLKRYFIIKFRRQIFEMGPAQADTYIDGFSRLAEYQHNTADVLEHLVAGTLRETEARQKLKDLQPPTPVREKVHAALGDRVGAPTFKEVRYIPPEMASAKQRIAVVAARERLEGLLRDPNLDPALRQKYEKLLAPKTIQRKGPTGDTYPVQVDRQFVVVEKPYAGKAPPEQARALTTEVTKRILGTKANYKLSPEKALELVRKLRIEAANNTRIANLGRKLAGIPTVAQPSPTRPSEIEIRPTSVEGPTALPPVPIVPGAASIAPTLAQRGITPFSGIKNPELLKAVRLAEEQIADPEILKQIYKSATNKKGIGNAGLNSYAKALNELVAKANVLVGGVSQHPISGLGTDFVVDDAHKPLLGAIRAAEHKVAEIAGDETVVKRLYNIVTEVHGTGDAGLIRYAHVLKKYIDDFGGPKTLASHAQELQKSAKTPVQKSFADALRRLFSRIVSHRGLYTLADRNKVVDQIVNRTDSRLLQIIKALGSNVFPISGADRPNVMGYYDPTTSNIGILGHNRLALLASRLLGYAHVAGRVPSINDTLPHEAGHRLADFVREGLTQDARRRAPGGITYSPWDPRALIGALLKADIKLPAYLQHFYDAKNLPDEVFAEAFARWYRGSGLSPKAASLISSWIKVNPYIPKELRLWEMAGAGKDFKPSSRNSTLNRAILASTSPDAYITPYSEYPDYGVRATPAPGAKDARKSALTIFYGKDLGPFIEKVLGGWQEMTKALHYGFMPTVGADPKVLDLLYKFMGERNEKAYAFQYALKPLADFFGGLPQAEQIQFIDNYKEGKPQTTPELQKIDGFIREIEDNTYKALLKYRPDLPYVENHLRTLWKKVPGAPESFAERFFAGAKIKRSLEGTKGQFRQHTLTNLSEGLEMGGVPFTYNPMKMLELAIGDDIAYLSAHKMWDEAGDLGFRVFRRRGEPMPEGFIRLGSNIARVIHPETTIKGRTVPVEEGEWVVREDFGHLLNHYTSRDVIRGTVLGRGLMELKNLQTGFELGLSPFHFTFINNEILSTVQGMGIYRMAQEGTIKGVRAGGKEVFSSPKALIDIPKLGGMIRQFSRDPSVLEKTPEGRKFMADNPNLAEGIHMLFTGGLLLDQPRDFQIRWEDAWNQTKADNNTIGRIVRAIPYGMERIARPLFDVYIPNVKVAVALKMYSEGLTTHAVDLASGKLTKLTLARQVVADTENRFGEMNFDRLFLNRTLKTALQFVARSITWKIGTLGAFAGAMGGQGREFAKAFQGRMPGLDRRAAWLLGILITTALMNELIQYGFTGKHIWETDTPEIDMLFARTGGVDARGYPLRATAPTYMRDMVAMLTQPDQYLKGSLSAAVGKTADIMTNKNWQGVYIYNPTDARSVKVLKSFGHIVGITPIGVQQLAHGTKTGGVARGILSFVGFTGTGAKGLEYSPAVKKALELSHAHGTFGRTAEQAAEKNTQTDLVRLGRNGQWQDFQAKAREALNKKELSAREVNEAYKEAHQSWLLKLVKPLTLVEMRQVYEEASPEEKTELRKAMSTKTQNAIRAHGAKAVGEILKDQ